LKKKKKKNTDGKEKGGESKLQKEGFEFQKWCEVPAVPRK